MMWELITSIEQKTAHFCSFLIAIEEIPFTYLEKFWDMHVDEIWMEHSVMSNLYTVILVILGVTLILGRYKLHEKHSHM